MTEKQAFELMRDGDRTAMAWVYKNYRDRIAHFFMSKEYGCTQMEAKDLAQDTILKLAELLEKGKLSELKVQLLTLLLGIAKKLYANAKRKGRLPYTNWNPLEFSDEEESFDDDFQERLEMEELMEKLKPAVQEMGEPCQTILTEFYWNHKTDKEIGVMINKSAAATKMKRRHCIESLRKLFYNH